MKKHIAGLVVVTGLLPWTATAAWAQTAEEYEQLKAQYEALQQDHENVVAQAQVLLQYKTEVAAAQKKMEQVDAQSRRWEIEQQALMQDKRNLQEELERSRSKLRDLEIQTSQLQDERDTAQEKAAVSKAGTMVVDELRLNLKDQQRQLRRRQREIEKLKKTVAGLKEKAVRQETIQAGLTDQLNELKSKYEDAVRQNSLLAKKVDQQPAEYAAMARENKVLLQRTALMHYNLGVFYTKNKEYPRAISEFEKAIELQPDDAQSYFNLGYIYSEFYDNRPKAIENFQRYLRVAKSGDKDVDWVKRYLLTWQTWEGKTTVK